MSTPKLAFLFPGGGTQYIGMGKEMYDQHPAVRELFEEANDVMHFNLKKIAFEGSLDKLSEMNNAQPAIFVVSFAAYEVFRKEFGITPSFACGHSLGEYAALASSGALRFGDALRLIKQRGLLLRQAGDAHDATMMAVSKIGSSLIEEACEKLTRKGGQAFIAVYNSEKQHVISGSRKTIGELATLLEREGAEPVILNINTASHCPLMKDAAAAFSEELRQIQYAPPAFPVISNVSGMPYTSDADISEILTQHLVRPVQWHRSIHFLEEQQVTHAIELGPQAVLKNLMPFITKQIVPFSFDVGEDVVEMKRCFAKRTVTPEDVVKKCIAVAVSTKNYNEDEKAYDDLVPGHFEKLQQLNASGRQPSMGTYSKEAITLLKEILDAKKTPEDEKLACLSILAALAHDAGEPVLPGACNKSTCTGKCLLKIDQNKLQTHA